MELLPLLHDQQMTFLSIVKALYSYEAANADELSFLEDDILYVTDKSDSDWWSAIIKKNGERMFGLVPSNYLEQANSVDFVKCLYSYTASDEEEISFVENDTMYIYDKSDPDWWIGQSAKGFGFVPSNYFESVVIPPSTSTVVESSAEVAQDQKKNLFAAFAQIDTSEYVDPLKEYAKEQAKQIDFVDPKSDLWEASESEGKKRKGFLHISSSEIIFIKDKIAQKRFPLNSIDNIDFSNKKQVVFFVSNAKFSFQMSKKEQPLLEKVYNSKKPKTIKLETMNSSSSVGIASSKSSTKSVHDQTPSAAPIIPPSPALQGLAKPKSVESPIKQKEKSIETLVKQKEIPKHPESSPKKQTVIESERSVTKHEITRVVYETPKFSLAPVNLPPPPLPSRSYPSASSEDYNTTEESAISPPLPSRNYKKPQEENYPKNNLNPTKSHNQLSAVEDEAPKIPLRPSKISAPLVTEVPPPIKAEKKAPIETFVAKQETIKVPVVSEKPSVYKEKGSDSPAVPARPSLEKEKEKEKTFIVQPSNDNAMKNNRSDINEISDAFMKLATNNVHTRPEATVSLPPKVEALMKLKQVESFLNSKEEEFGPDSIQIQEKSGSNHSHEKYGLGSNQFQGSSRYEASNLQKTAPPQTKTRHPVLPTAFIKETSHQRREKAQLPLNQSLSSEITQMMQTSKPAATFSNPQVEPLPGDLRVWSDVTGSFRVEARYVKYENGQVTLHKSNGVFVTVPLELLSKEDCEYVRIKVNLQKTVLLQPLDPNLVERRPSSSNAFLPISTSTSSIGIQNNAASSRPSSRPSSQYGQTQSSIPVPLLNQLPSNFIPLSNNLVPNNVNYMNTPLNYNSNTPSNYYSSTPSNYYSSNNPSNYSSNINYSNGTPLNYSNNIPSNINIPQGYPNNPISNPSMPNGMYPSNNSGNSARMNGYTTNQMLTPLIPQQAPLNFNSAKPLLSPSNDKYAAIRDIDPLNQASDKNLSNPTLGWNQQFR